MPVPKTRSARRRAPAHSKRSRKAALQPLPCPFCGAPPAVVAARARGEYAHAQVACETADCPVSPKLDFFGGERSCRSAGDARRHAIERWNTRTDGDGEARRLRAGLQMVLDLSSGAGDRDILEAAAHANRSARELAGEIARQLARFFRYTPTIAVLAGKLDRFASGKLKDFK